MIWTKLLALVSILAVPMICPCQDTTSGGPDSIIAGPFGEPRMVMSEGGEWSYPLKVYEDTATTAYTPDITTPGWVAGNADQFRRTGKYLTYLYVYTKRKHTTARYTLVVETRSNTAVVAQPFLNQHISLSDHATPEFISKSAAKITAIVTNEVARFQGDTVEDVIRKEKYTTLRMMLCSAGPGNPNPDCNLSDSDLRAKYPTYAGNPLQLIPGADPGVNCGIGTGKSCYANDPKASNSPSLPSGAQANADGLYRIGNGVSAPVPLNSVIVEFTDVARRAKYQGVCLVSLTVDAQGNPQNPRVVRGLGMGLNQKALEAVQKYRFKPAMLDGKTPVPVMITVEVNFRLY